MDLDILFPFHRVDRYLDSAIHSLNNSQGVNFRLIAIDDRMDKSIDIFSLFANVKNLELVETQGGQGYGYSLKLGSSYIDSNIIALMNSDDLVHQNRFKRQLFELDNFDLCFTKMQKIDGNGKSIPFLTGDITSRHYENHILLFGSYGANATWCMRKDWWKNNAFFDKNECLDWRIALKTFTKSKISMLNDYLYFYRKHPAQVTSNLEIDYHQLDVVYDCWLNLCNELGLENNTRLVFDTLATPWLKIPKTNYIEIQNWLKCFSKLKLSQSDELKKNLSELIKRRLVFASMSKNTLFRQRPRFLLSGISSVPNITIDILKSIKRN